MEENGLSGIPLGERLKKMRNALSLTQEELAARLSVTRQAVSNWESGKRLPDIYMLQKIAREYEISLDELCGGIEKEPQVKMGKAPSVLLAGTLTAITVYFIAGIAAGRFYGETAAMMVIIGILCQLFLHLYLSGAVKNNNFCMIAGFDSKTSYNMKELKKMLIQMDMHISCSSFAVVLLLFISSFVEENFLGTILMVYYSLDLTISIIIYNYRSLDKILTCKEDITEAKAGWKSILWFVTLVFAACGTFPVQFILHRMENNSINALKWSGLLILYLIVITVELFYEQKRAKKYANTQFGYHMGKAFLAATTIAAVLLLWMLLPL